MAEASPAGKKLKDLKVVDLKAELEKRGLATSGVKVILTDRLSKFLEEEEKVDPNEYVFGAEEEVTKEQEEPAAAAADAAAAAEDVAPEEQIVEKAAPEEPAPEDPLPEESAAEEPEEAAEETPKEESLEEKVAVADEPVVLGSEQDPVEAPVAVGEEEKEDQQEI